MRHMNYRARSAGFSLVEVMVAVVVICVGLLGIAKMQAMSLSTTTTSRQRALAALQAASMASAMHSNRQYWVGTAVGAAAFTATITHGATSASLPTVASANRWRAASGAPCGHYRQSPADQSAAAVHHQRAGRHGNVRRDAARGFRPGALVGQLGQSHAAERDRHDRLSADSCGQPTPLDLHRADPAGARRRSM